MHLPGYIFDQVVLKDVIFAERHLWNYLWKFQSFEVAEPGGEWLKFKIGDWFFRVKVFPWLINPQRIIFLFSRNVPVFFYFWMITGIYPNSAILIQILTESLLILSNNQFLTNILTRKFFRGKVTNLKHWLQTFPPSNNFPRLTLAPAFLPDKVYGNVLPVMVNHILRNFHDYFHVLIKSQINCCLWNW